MENGLTFPKGGRVPYLTADRYHLDLTGEGYDALLIRFPRSVWGAGCFLVIDVYSERNHVHPNGHVGWWRFELEGRKPVAIRLARTDDGICANYTFMDTFYRLKNIVRLWSHPRNIVQLMGKNV